MSATIGASTPFVTVVQLAGHWCCLKVNANQTKNIIGQPLADKKAAKIAAKHFAVQHGYLYQKNACVFNKPIVTIWRALNCWIPAKIFEDRIEGAGFTAEKKEDAKSEAKRLAEEQDLEYFPSIGESAFANIE